MARSETPSTIRLRICALRTIGSLFTSPNVIHHAVHVKKKLDFVLTTAIQSALRYDQNQHLRNEGEQLNIMLSSKKKPLSPAGLRLLLEKALDKGWVRELPHSDVDRAYRNISDDDIQASNSAVGSLKKPSPREK